MADDIVTHGTTSGSGGPSSGGPSSEGPYLTRSNGRIALLIDCFDSAYQAALVRCMRQACKRRGLSLVAFPGGVIRGVQLSAKERNWVYDLISAERFDGVIVLSGTMTREVSAQVVADFCERFRPLAMCSIGSRLEDIPSYVVDNASGMRGLVRHLVLEHGYRRLAFIGGPCTNEEAKERLLAFRGELEVQGVPLTSESIVHGDFMPLSGQTALHLLLHRMSPPPEAIVAANDAMAMGALEALTSYPSDVSRRIAVCGFDNVVETDFCSPPLTTVEQPLRALAEAAVEGIADQLAGEECPEVTRLSTRPVYRRSCGCDTTQAAAPEMQKRKASRGSSVLEFMRNRESILSQLSTAASEAYEGVPNWCEHLLEAFTAEIRGVPEANFLVTVRELLHHTVVERPGETWRFHNVLSAMRRHCLPCVAGDLTQWARAEDLLQAARTLAGEAVLRGQARRLLNADQQHLVANYVGSQLGEASSVAELDAVLQRAVRRLGMRRLITVSLESPQRSSAPCARVISHADSSQPGEVDVSRLGPYPFTQLLPVDDWLEGNVRSWVALPLFYRHEPLGFLLADLCLWDGKIYESLRVHISASLWACARTSPTPPPGR